MVKPFITFKGNANEAINFYEEVFNGTDKKVMYYGDMPSDPEFKIDENKKNWVLHGTLNICGSEIMFSDTDESLHNENTFNPSCMISIAVDFKSEDEIRSAYEKLKEGGYVMMELSPQFFAGLYAWVSDKFGVTWQMTYSTH
ncbi:VOC family protein [Candidatus Arthromitus sp. SFB-rat-Yit]|uniref:VOC family protein n=1 Tax=Candidatus Arthromitus sp. SFB-rat-Yit TaxID=1041504 RepID=UPI000227A623|nr:VOC family protein [Candidatus Arthromitus sp. SFB-rat-Yit]BAK80577.1 phnB protein [Candidatus Arthromitus sp. SFB-rat-Yit]